MRWTLGVAALLMAVAGQAHAQTGIETLTTKGAPFAIVASADSHRLFVTLSEVSGNGRSGLATFALDTKLTEDGFVALDGTPVGAALSHDGHWLAVAAMSNLYLIDATQIASGKAAIKWKLTTDSSIGAAFSPDDQYLFVPQEHDARIAVIALGATPGTRPEKSAVRSIATGDGPIAVVPSPDGRYLYATSEVAPGRLHWPSTCAGEQGPGSPGTARGVVLTIDMAVAETDPAHAVLATAPAGCIPVRLALSHDGKTAYVTARKDNDVLIMDTAKLLGDPDNAVTASVRIDGTPVGIAVDSKRNLVFATRSDRFSAGTKPSSVAVIDINGPPKVIGQIPAGLFPRELTLTPDGKWLIIGNYLSGMIEKVDLEALR